MNADNTDRSDVGFDDFADAAGAALRRPAPEGGLAGVRSSRQRRRVVQGLAATGAAAIVFVAGALLFTTNGDDAQRLVTSDSIASTSPESSSAESSTSTSTPTTSTVVDVAGSPFTLTADTPVLWADGVLVAAWIDESFVPADEITGFPFEMLDTPVELIDRTGGLSTWTPHTDDCGITRLRSVDDDRRFEQGYLWSSDYPMSGTLDGAAQSNSTDLDIALGDLGVDPASLDRLVPSADLDGDPDEEVVIVRYDPDTAPTDTRNAVWLAVWDPATTSITTLAGDPTSNDTHFTAFGDGIADSDANGFYDTVVDTGDTVTLIELSTGTILSNVDTPCSDPEDSVPAVEDGAVDGPLMRHPIRSDGEGGNAAVVGGVLELANDCLYLSIDDIGERYPVLWPAGTAWDAQRQVVVLPTGEEIPVGGLADGGGGYSSVDVIETIAGSEAAGLAMRCVDNSDGEIAVVNNYDTAIGPR